MPNQLNCNPESLKQFDYGMRDLSRVINELKLAEACFYNVWQDSGGAYDAGVLVSAYIRLSMYRQDCEQLVLDLKKIKGKS